MFEISGVLDTLYAGKSLSQTQAFGLFNSIMHGEQPEAVIASVLTALKIKHESPQEIAGAAGAMVSNALPFPTPAYDFADIVGTGGDGHNTINISSAAGVVAAACGAKVAKHGNRSVSSRSGSADLFREFGVELEITAETARRCLDDANFCFLYAPVYHAGMRYAAPVRAALKTRTLFNILGPLANPASPTHGVYGVYSPDLLEAYAKTLMLLGQRKALVVHGAGLDELALHDASQVIELTGSEMRRYTVTPEDFGLSRYPLSAIEGGEPEENRAMIAAALGGTGQPAHEAAIAMNCGALLKVTGIVDTFEEGANMAVASMQAGEPLNVLQQVAQLSQETHNG